MATQEMPRTDSEVLKRRIERERKARLSAEAIAERGMRQLYQKQQEVELLRQVAAAANEAQTIEDAMQVAVDRVCSYTGWPVGHAYILAQDSSRQLVSSVWHLKSPERFATLRKISNNTIFTTGVGLPGRVLASGSPAWIVDVTKDNNFPRAKLAQDIGVRAAFGFPVLIGKEVVAVLEFFSDIPREPDEPLLEAMAHIGTQLGRVIERKRYEEKLIHNAFHDSLTQLPNRALFLERLAQALARAKRRKNYLFAVLFIDLDRFKLVNDSMGHSVGDGLIREIGEILQQGLRAGDTVARLGGDEYAILLDDIGQASHTSRAVERIRRNLESTLTFDRIFVSASIGIALSSTGYERPEEILRDADIAMYRAKSQGRGLSVVFNANMHEQAVKLLYLESDLKRALDRQEFCLHYQPIVSLTTGGIAGFEGLIRWQHPNRGLVPPGDFIPVAEESELILPITQWALNEASVQLRKWKEQFQHCPISVSVNLNTKYFTKRNFLSEIVALIARNGFDPCSLKLEITESQIMERAESMSKILVELDNFGIKVYVDDFGTGYSSLSYLSKFRVHAIKVDRSFVSNLGNDERNSTIVRTIIALGHQLGLNVIAEGIETEKQLQFLLEEGCQHGQGYYFSKPVPEAKAVELIRANGFSELIPPPLLQSFPS